MKLPKLTKPIIAVIIGVVVLAIVGTVGALNGWFGGKSGESFASTLLPDYQYRRPITLSGQTSDLTDYQVKIELPASLTSALVSDGKLQSDFDDIRFTDADDNQLLNFWIETATTTATSTIWVKVPGLSANKSSQIYMYYGNPSASSASNGDNTFEFFDDFEDGDLSTGGTEPWTVHAGTPEETGGELVVNENDEGVWVPFTNLNSVWQFDAKVDAVGAHHCPVMRLANGSTWRYRLFINTDPADKAIYLNIGGGGNVFSLAWIADTNWHTFKLTRNQNNVWKMYVDDDYKGEGTNNTWSDWNRVYLKYYAGSYSPTTIHFDNFRVRKYASPEPTATVGSQENSNWSPEAAWISGATWVTGKFGTALSFDGLDDYVKSSTQIPSSNTFSYSLWFSPNTLSPSANQYLFNQGSDDPSVYIGTNGDLNVNINSNFKIQISKSHLKIQNWNHLEITGDGSTLKAYLNGALVGSASYTGSSANAVLYLGSASSTANFFSGKIDDVRIYNYARTPDEIALDYNAGLAVKLGGSPGTTTPAIHEWRFEEGTGSTVADSRKGAKLLNDYGSVRPITITNSTSTLSDYQVSVDLTSADSLVDGLVGSWHMNASTSGNASGTTIVDSSGNSNNGTAYSPNGTGMQWTTGVEGGALDFDGVDDYVDCGNDESLNITDAITIEAWVKCIGPTSDDQKIAVATTPGENKYPYLFDLSYDANWELRFFHRNSADQVDNIASGSTQMNDNEWHHVAVTISDSTLKFWVDGIQDGTTKTLTYTRDIVGSPVLTIGNNADHNQCFNGTLDEVRIYNRALSQDEIKKSFCIGAKRLYDAGTWTLEKYQSAYAGSAAASGPASYDWRDIRFSNINNQSLNYWLESDKTAWVKVPTIPGNSDSQIYMYYGNPSASSASNGSATFEFFDDFEGNSLDGTKWTFESKDQYGDPASGSYSVANGEIYIEADYPTQMVYAQITTIPTFTAPYIVEGRFAWYSETMSSSRRGGQKVAWIKDGTNSLEHYNGDPSASSYNYYDIRYGTTSSDFYVPDGEPLFAVGELAGSTKTYHKAKYQWASGDIQVWIDDISKGTSAQTFSLGATGIIFQAHNWDIQDNEAVGLYIDYTFVRKYASPEPSVVVGSRLEAGGTPVGQVNLTLSAGSGGANTSAADMWATPSAGSSQAAGKYGSAIEFDGTDDYAYTSSALIGSDTFSYSLWFKPNQIPPSANQYLFNQGTDDPSVYIDTSGDLNVAINGSQILKIENWKLIENCKLKIENWSHLELTGDGSTLKAYLNGVLVGSASYTGSTADAQLYIGSASSTAGFFNGLIDDFRIYNYARSADDVLVDFNAGFGIKLGGSPEQLNWYFEQNWQRKKAISIANTTSTDLTNYQVQISVSRENEMQPDYDDLRFTDATGKELSYWIEDKWANPATVWVKVPSLPANSTTTIYMYYGNPDALAASNGTNTFEFFDDFEGYADGTQLNGQGGWSGDTSFTITTAYAHHGTKSVRTSSQTVGIEHNRSFNVNEILRIDTMMPTKVMESMGGMYKSGVGHGATWDLESSTNALWARDDGSWVTVHTGFNAAQWYKYEILKISDTQWKLFEDGTEYGPYSFENTPADVIRIFTGGSEAGGDYVYWDSVLVRKYASPEPTVTVGAEQSTLMAQALWHFGEGSGTTAYDSTSHNNDCTISGASWTTGIIGKGLSFDGNDSVSCGNIGNVQSLSFWLAPFNLNQKVLELTATDNSTSTIELSSGKIDLEGTGWSSPKLYINGAEVGLDSNLQSVSTLRSHEWYHIEVVNGADISASAAVFGKVGSSYFSGLMDEIMVYDYARSATQVRTDFNAGMGIHFK